MKIGERAIQVTHEDWVVGGIMQRAQGDPSMVLPALNLQVDERDDLRDRFTALRRLAIEFGIDASEDEVDRAIAQAVKVIPTVESPSQLAVQMLGYGSLQAYRVVVKEALRIGTLLRLEVAGVDTSDAALVQKLLDDSERMVLTVAAFDKKAVEESLKEKGIEDAELQAWLAELEDADQRAFQAPNRASLSAVGLLYDGFDRELFAAELEGTEFDEARIRTAYERRKAKYFRIEKPAEKDGEDGENKDGENEESSETPDPEKKQESNGKDDDGEDAEPQEGQQGSSEEQTGGEQAAETEKTGEVAGDPETAEPEEQEPQPPEPEFLPFEDVKDRVETMLLAEAVMDHIRFGKLEEALAEHMLPAIEARNAAMIATSEARKAVTDAEKKLEDDPDNDDKKAAVETAKEAIEPAEEAEKAAVEALDERRTAFDFSAQMTALIGGRKGFVTFAEAEPKASGDFGELGPLGKWDNAAMIETMESAGDVSSQLQRTVQACFHFQVPQLEKNPLKPFDEIADQARAEYFVKQADELAKTDSEKLEEALLTLAKAKIADKVTELENESKKEVEDGFNEWKTGLETELATAKKTLDGYRDRPESRIFKAWNDQVAKLESKLGKQDDKRKELEEAAAEELEADIKKQARKVYKDVLAAAVADTGFVVEDLEAFPVDLSTRPRFEHRFSEKVRFLFGDPTVKELEEGEVTDIPR